MQVSFTCEPHWRARDAVSGCLDLTYRRIDRGWYGPLNPAADGRKDRLRLRCLPVRVFHLERMTGVRAHSVCRIAIAIITG